jgi:penicillin-binding protein 1B
VDFTRPQSPVVSKLVAVNGSALDHLTLEAPLLAALAPGERQRILPLKRIPQVMIDAVLSIEDRRFYDHPGVDPIGVIRAVVTNMRGDKPYLVGGSTLTQQIVKNTFPDAGKEQDPETAGTVHGARAGVALHEGSDPRAVPERRRARPARPVRDPRRAEASRIFFGKDVSNVTLAEAATIAGIIQTPSRLSPFRNPDRARERRNVVLKEMADQGKVPEGRADAAALEPLRYRAARSRTRRRTSSTTSARLVESSTRAAEEGRRRRRLHDARPASAAAGAGSARRRHCADRQDACRQEEAGQAQAALVAVDPRTGEILAFVGGRAYNQSQLNRVGRRETPAGLVFKPFVYLSASSRWPPTAARLTPATVMTDEPTTFKDGEKDYAPSNYRTNTTGRLLCAGARALAQRRRDQGRGSRRLRYRRDFWKRIGPNRRQGLSLDRARRLRSHAARNGHGLHDLHEQRQVRPLQAISHIVENSSTRNVPPAAVKAVARPDTTFLVVNMMRSVLERRHGRRRARGRFTLDAAGKSGTTNDLRDAWFIGFTPSC